MGERECRRGCFCAWLVRWGGIFEGMSPILGLEGGVIGAWVPGLGLREIWWGVIMFFLFWPFGVGGGTAGAWCVEGRVYMSGQRLLGFWDIDLNIIPIGFLDFCLLYTRQRRFIRIPLLYHQSLYNIRILITSPHLASDKKPNPSSTTPTTTSNPTSQWVAAATTVLRPSSTPAQAAHQCQPSKSPSAEADTTQRLAQPYQKAPKPATNTLRRR